MTSMLRDGLRLALLLALVVVLSLAVAHTEVVEVGGASVSVGDRADIPVLVRGMPDVAGAVVHLRYDPSSLEVAGVRGGDLGAPEHSVSDGVVKLSVASPRACNRDPCVIAYLTVRALRSGSTYIEVTYAELSDVYGKLVAPERRSGLVMIKPKEEVRPPPITVIVRSDCDAEWTISWHDVTYGVRYGRGSQEFNVQPERQEEVRLTMSVTSCPSEHTCRASPEAAYARPGDAIEFRVACERQWVGLALFAAIVVALVAALIALAVAVKMRSARARSS